jgi:hypothetical protein
MPTARELLDQADALMRRNRSAVIDDIPVLTDSVMPVAEAYLRSRAAQPRAPGQVPSSDPIPTLTERVLPGPPAPAGAVAEEGEPSDWLQLGAGERSVIGDAPDSIAIVPAVTSQEVIEVIAPAEVEEAFDLELAGRAMPPPAVPLEPPPSAASLAAVFAKAPPEATAPLLDDDVVEIESIPDAAEEIDEDAAPSAVAFDTPAIVSEEPAEPVVEARMQAAPEALDDAILGAPLEAVAARTALESSEKARWDAVAEEIRVQVLQRIDLFTDTGLREQLGARLQPIVDRASADLVATINQHVGELLRSYVSEAIEREIESWRRGIDGPPT